MKNRAFCGALLVAIFASQHAPYRAALPGYRYEFPRDFFAHPDFQTEWWYTTGNIKTSDGRPFGYELTFFRQGVNREASQGSAWAVHDLYLAHLALSDLNGGHFYCSQRLNRAGPGIAGAYQQTGKVWNGNWSVVWDKNGTQRLSAGSEDFQLSFTLKSEKPPIIHGEDGVSQKAEGVGRASHYFSQTRLVTSGTIDLKGKRNEVSGLSWMDHEFFSQQLSQEQSGWNWFSIQLEDKTELMLFILRRRDGSVDAHSAGTYVDSAGNSSHLRAVDFSLAPTGATWKSPSTGAAYPIEWNVAVPKLGLVLLAKTKLAEQEVIAGTKLAPSYWEGAMDFSGSRGSSAIHGTGYLEMTGYDRPFQLGK